MMYDYDDFDNGATWLDHQGGEVTLIVFANTGKRYKNQTGGVSCDKQVAEGYVVQLEGDDSDLSGACDYSCYVDESRLLRVQRVIDRQNWPVRLEVDSSQSSQEAWVYVRIDDPDGIWTKDGETTGVLTWNNSD